MTTQPTVPSSKRDEVQPSHAATHALIEFLIRERKRFPAACGGAAPTADRIQRLFGLFRSVAFPDTVIPREPRNGDSIDQALTAIVNQFQTEMVDIACWTLQQSETIDDQNRRRIVRDKIDRVLERLPFVIELLYLDIQAACDGDPACTGPQEVIVCYPGFLATMIHRLAHELYRVDLKLLARVLSEWAHSETGIDIHPGATIGHHFFIDHGTGVVIGETCHVGNHVKIYQGVTLGALSFSKDEQGRVIREAKRHPTIEDHVVIYASATILGGTTVIGHHSVVGGSVWLTHSIDPFTTVVMEAPRLKMRSKTDKKNPIDEAKVD